VVDLAAIRRLDQRRPAREVAVEGPDAHAGPLGDRLEGDVGARLGERLGRSGQQPLAVAACVGALGSLGLAGRHRD
jgi:hypothetical protein